MHIFDGFLSTPVWATLDAVSLPAVGWVAHRARQSSDDRRIPLLGVMGAFVFAAQMINFPVGFGTSGHLVGGTLLSVVLGPVAACIVMTAILTLQAFVFQDGGIVVLGANLFNMALAGVLAGYLPYRHWGVRFPSASIFAGGVLSVMVSGCLALAQVLLSGAKIPPGVLALLLTVFLANALLEGAITVSAVGAIQRLSGRAIGDALPARSHTIGAIAVISLVLAVGAGLIASASPDGIEQLAQRLGMSEGVPWLRSPLADYEFAMASAAWMRKAAAGLAGIALIYALCLAVGRALTRRSA